MWQATLARGSMSSGTQAGSGLPNVAAQLLLAAGLLLQAASTAQTVLLSCVLGIWAALPPQLHGDTLSRPGAGHGIVAGTTLGPLVVRAASADAGLQALALHVSLALAAAIFVASQVAPRAMDCSAIWYVCDRILPPPRFPVQLH